MKEPRYRVLLDERLLAESNDAAEARRAFDELTASAPSAGRLTLVDLESKGPRGGPLVVRWVLLPSSG